jgi:hypothetical protein
MFDVPQHLRFFNVDSKAVDRARLADLRQGNSRFPVHQRRRRPSNPYSQICGSLRIPHHAEQELERGNSRSAEAAARAAFFMAVLLFGVPFLRPARRSPGLDPRGIAIFATFAIQY